MSVEADPALGTRHTADTIVADSKHLILLWEDGKVLAVYLFVKEDARMNFLHPSDYSTRGPP